VCGIGGAASVNKKKGVHDPKFVDKLKDWGKKGGHSSFHQKRGWFDPANAQLVTDGQQKGSGW
jgi:hypothetical protein